MADGLPAVESGLARRMGAAAIILGGGVLLSRFAGFFRDMFIAAIHGADRTTDTYFAAFTLPDILNHMLAGGALSISFVPLFARRLASGDEEGGWRCFSITVTAVTAAMVLLTAVAMVFAPRIVPLLVPGFPPEAARQVVRITRIILPAQVFFMAGGILSGTLYARKQFVAPALAPLVYNVFIILGGLALHRMCGIEGFAWGVLAGAVAGPFGVPLVAAWRPMRYRPAISLRDPDFLEFLRLTLPLMVGFSLLTVDEWLCRYFGSEVPGVITHVNNARRLMLVPTAVLGFSAGTAALPFLAQLHAEGRAAEMGQALGQALRGVAQVSLVASGALAAVALPLVTLVFGRGRFGPADVEATAGLLALFCAGIGAWGLQGVAVRGFYAMGDTLTPMLVSTGVTLVAVGGYAALWKALGAAGLPVATSLGMALTALATLAWLHRRRVSFAPARLGATVLRAAALAAVGFAAARGAALPLRGVLDPLKHPDAALLLGMMGSAYAAAVLVLARRIGLPEVAALPARLLGRLARRHGSARQ